MLGLEKVEHTSNHSYHLVLCSRYRQNEYDIDQSLKIQLEQLEVGEKIILQNLQFDIDKSEILSRSKIILYQLTDILEANPNMKIEISGHTSTTGDLAHNMELSERRAKAVRHFLIQQGVNPQRLLAAGFGPNQLIAPNDTEQNRQRNRRVEVRILEK